MGGRETIGGGESEEKRLLEEASRLLELVKDLQQSVSLLISKTWTKEKSLRIYAATLDSDLQNLHTSFPQSLELNVSDKMNEKLHKARILISDGDLASLLLTRTNGGFLKAFLGPVDVRTTRKDVRLKVKEEYNNYRIEVVQFEPEAAVVAVGATVGYGMVASNL